MQTETKKLVEKIEKAWQTMEKTNAIKKELTDKLTPEELTISIEKFSIEVKDLKKLEKADRRARLARVFKDSADKLYSEAGVPELDTVVEKLKLKPGQKARVFLVDGNKQPIRKMSIFRYWGALMPIGWRNRIS